MSHPSRFLAVKNFASHQHYKDRRPPWIKFYVSILNDYAFLQLPEAQQRHLMFLWQLAAIHDNRIPNDPKYIATAIKARGKIDFAGLIAAGFLLEVGEQDASTDASTALPGNEPFASVSRTRESQSTEAQGETQTEKAKRTGRNTNGEASLLLLQIRRLAGTPPTGIPKPSIDALGPGVLTAYEAVGGWDRVIKVEGRDHSFLSREFAAALEAARSQHQ